MIVTCSDLAARLTELEEGPASAVERASLKLHLSICARCRRYVAELEKLKGLLGDLGSAPEAPEGSTAPASLARALDAFRAWKSGGSRPDDD